MFSELARSAHPPTGAGHPESRDSTDGQTILSFPKLRERKVGLADRSMLEARHPRAAFKNALSRR